MIFNQENAETICQNCMFEEKKILKKVTDYLRNHPLANIMEVHEKTQVEEVQIIRFIKSGSLKIRKPTKEFECRFCGKPVKRGTICDSCADKLSDSFDEGKK